RRKATRSNLEVPDGAVDERSEQSAEVKWIEDRVAVEQDQVLVGFAAADVEPRREVVARLDPRQHLRGAQHIGLAEARHRRQHLAGNERYPEVGPRFKTLALGRLRLAAYRAERGDPLDEDEVDDALFTGSHVDGLVGIGVSDEARAQSERSGGHIVDRVGAR